MQENKQEHFIKNIEIKNFKCFEDFKAEGFGRVNLIGGKNNVGKTAFMEAIYILSSNTSTDSLDEIVPFLTIEKLRELLEIEDDIITVSEIIKIFERYNNLELTSKKLKVKLKIEKDGIVEKFLINNQDSEVSRQLSKEMFKNKQKLYNFIPSYMIGNDLIISLFDKIKSERKRNKLNIILNDFDNNIEEFDIIENQPQVFLKNIQKFQDVAELGHGLKRYIAIISSILINKNGFLFLDELENGIHYTHLNKLWEIILTISKQQNVQVFATTHSKECIESYARVAKKLEDEEIGFIELGRNKKNELDSVVMDSEMFQRFVKLGNEVRGW
jgi:AAA15 family ATPase/GTPase